MPGGEDYRRWYAMRDRLKRAGKWKGKTPTHSVPEQEEGEPAPKQPALEEPEEIATPESLPPLEDSPTEEGIENVWFYNTLVCKTNIFAFRSFT